MRKTIVPILLLSACGVPNYDRVQSAVFVCPDGAICAGPADGGTDGGIPCDPNQWQDPTICPTGQVCTSDGICAGPPCGNGNTVCDSTTLCAIEGNGNKDCAPQCTAAGKTIYRGTTSCATRGLLTDAANGKCFVPCWIDECFVLGDNFCGPPIDMSKIKDEKRVAEAISRLNF
jgi:hypothetical protein